MILQLLFQRKCRGNLDRCIRGNILLLCQYSKVRNKYWQVALSSIAFSFISERERERDDVEKKLVEIV